MHPRDPNVGLDLPTPPNCIFLDTNVVNKVVEFGEYLFDNYLAEEEREEYDRRPVEDQEDIEALHDICLVGQRLCLPLYISDFTIHELSQTPIEPKRQHLLNYAREVFDHWLQWGDRKVKAAYLKKKRLQRFKRLMPKMAFIPDEGDRFL
ncbi:MAG: hypothetical protein ACRD2L_20310, partial [Terriglobia bacterium]